MQKPHHDFRDWAERLRRLHAALAELGAAAQSLGVGAPAERPWYELLVRKLLPQTHVEPWLVVAVVGGTNIGKSLLFNHLAGERASGVSPLAAGTKHPVCLVPPGFTARGDLDELFRGFDLAAWHAADDALHEADADRLFWREGRNVPPRLLLLDTPDIDSDRQVNWRRADAIRDAADVLVAVLTQQKYNDAAVKQFFRRAAAADKATIIVFNQIDLHEDRAFWPLWLETFTAETGATPEAVYVVPHDRAAAGELALPFFEVGRDGRGEPTAGASLRDDLAALKFDAIKFRTLRGALQQVAVGVPEYLAGVRAAAGDFERMLNRIGEAGVPSTPLPRLPTSVVVDEIHRWWDAHRPPLTRAVHGTFQAAWRGLTWPIRKATELRNAAPTDPLTAFRAAEWDAITLRLGAVYEEFSRLAEIGDELLRPRLRAILAGDARARLMSRFRAAHESRPAIDQEFRGYLDETLAQWVRDYPGWVRTLRVVDNTAAALRPVLTVSLFMSGFFLVDGAAFQAAAHAGGAAAGHLATEVAVAGGMAGAGDAAVALSCHGVKQALGMLFLKLDTEYEKRRTLWFQETLLAEFHGPLLAELRRGASLVDSPAYRTAHDTALALRGMVE